MTTKSTQVSTLPILVMLSIIIFTLSGCVPVRKIEYLKESDKGDIYRYAKPEMKSDSIEPLDMLSITVVSSDQADRNFLQNEAPMSNITDEGMALVAYTVDRQGYVHLPIIGAVRVAGLNLVEATEKLENAMMGYINQPIIQLRKVNRRVIVLGEVETPGTYIYSKDNMRVFDAISLAGDITDFGNRKSVFLIRLEGDEIIKKRLNLRDPKFVTTEDYYIEEDDIIFVKPLPSKRFDMIYEPLSLLLGMSTTILVIITYFQD